MITSFNTPVRELDGHIFVEAEELYKRDEIIEQLKKELLEEKQAYLRLYNMYDIEKEKKDKAIELLELVNKMKIKFTNYNSKEKDYIDTLLEILKGEDKE